MGMCALQTTASQTNCRRSSLLERVSILAAVSRTRSTGSCDQAFPKKDKWLEPKTPDEVADTLHTTFSGVALDAFGCLLERETGFEPVAIANYSYDNKQLQNRKTRCIQVAY
jgi:hypothetical protein